MRPDWFRLFILILACYRLAQLLALDEGPFGIFLKLRVIAGGYDYGLNGEPQTRLGRFMRCPYCWGVWLAALLTVVYTGLDWYSPVIWLAVAGGQAFLQGRSDGKY